MFEPMNFESLTNRLTNTQFFRIDGSMAKNSVSRTGNSTWLSKNQYQAKYSANLDLLRFKMPVHKRESEGWNGYGWIQHALIKQITWRLESLLILCFLGISPLRCALFIYMMYQTTISALSGQKT